MLANVDVDELVRHYCHFLQFKCLDPGTWEALDNPAELLFLVVLYLCPHDVDYNLIIN